MKVYWKELLLTFVSLALAGWKPSPNRAYVQSMRDGGTFYARSVPSTTGGWDGRTSIYRVAGENDELLDTYNVFSPGGVDLCWSPLAGKIAVLMWNESQERHKSDSIELRFFMGGKHLRDYNTTDLQKFGFTTAPSFEGGSFAQLKVDGCTQVPGTNHYRFVIQARVSDGSWKAYPFDILDGKLLEVGTGE